jgi:hypothetical protein
VQCLSGVKGLKELIGRSFYCMHTSFAGR